MAIAGPIASILIGCVFWFLKQAGQHNWPAEFTGVVGYLSWINWILAGFNLIPAFPLDGGRVLRSAIWHFTDDLTRATKIASWIGSTIGVLLMAFGMFQLFMGNIIGGIWYFLIAMFLRQAALMSYRQVIIRRALEGEPISRFMNPDPVTVPRGVSIRDFVENYFYRYHFKFFPVVNENRGLMGCVTARKVKEIPREEWSNHTVAEVAEPCSADNTISPDVDALDALSKMQKTNSSRLLVADHGQLLAIVSLKDLLRFLAAKIELEGSGKHLLNAPKM